MTNIEVTDDTPRDESGYPVLTIRVTELHALEASLENSRAAVDKLQALRISDAGTWADRCDSLREQRAEAVIARDAAEELLERKVHEVKKLRKKVRHQRELIHLYREVPK